MSTLELTHTRLLQLLSYDKQTGLFTWLVDRTRGVKAGDVAGSYFPKTGIVISIHGQRHSAHRLAFFYVNRRWPTNEVDHRDTDRRNNRWKNLRDVTSRVNQQNRRRPSVNNKTGFLGVCYDASKDKFVAQISVDKRVVKLGSFDDPLSAHEEYLTAKRIYHEGNTL